MSMCDTSATTPSLRAELAHYLQRAYHTAGCPVALEALNRCLFLVDALAITTTEYALLRNRLHNAQRYSKQSEWGAARYELRLLLHSLAAST